MPKSHFRAKFYNLESLPAVNLAPPSTATLTPLTYFPAGEHRKVATPPISSGSPNLPRGLSWLRLSSPPRLLIRPCASLLGKKPGAMELDVMLRGPSSTARFLARWSAAALDAAYMIVPFSPTWGTLVPAVELMMSNLDGSCLVPAWDNKGRNCCVNSNIPRTLRSRILVELLGGASSNREPQAAPALHTSMSNPRPPNTFLTSPANRTMSCESPTFAASPVALPRMPDSALSFSVACAMPRDPSSFRAVMMTCEQPESKKAVAMCRPSPLEPPVTTAVLPSSENIESKWRNSDMMACCNFSFNLTGINQTII